MPVDMYVGGQEHGEFENGKCNFLSRPTSHQNCKKISSQSGYFFLLVLNVFQKLPYSTQPHMAQNGFKCV